MLNPKKNEIYPSYLAMTCGDAEAMEKVNHKNQWGISYDELKSLCRKHRWARKRDDIRLMEKIEYRLDDINFHHESGMLSRGEYDALMAELEAA